MATEQRKKTGVPDYLWSFLIVFIITVPAFLHLINGQYFSMHDDQQIARLYLLDQGIRQGYLYPRWVDTLGFGYGYPLFNFYPPLVYYIGEFFHLIGFSLIWSVKLTFILGFIISAWGTYLFSRKFVGRVIAFIPAALYTYFFYHAVNAYVRGALAEFFSMAILPFVFLTIRNLSDKRTLKNALLFAAAFALLIINHPLIAFPSLIFVGAFFIFYMIISKKDQIEFAKLFVIGGCIGFCLSAFFWLPSLVEKKYTYIDKVLTHELANYNIHFIYPQQFWYSLWGFGGSVAGPSDGITFQLGKVHIALFLLALGLSLVYAQKRKKMSEHKEFYFFVALALFSIFMTIQASSFVWRSVSYLAYLQFPWRFLTFAGFFIAVVGGYSVLFLKELMFRKKNVFNLTLITTTSICLLTIGIYSKYFKPQFLRNVTDADLTSYEKIAWDVSKSSFEFVPQGVSTSKTDLGTTTLAIKKTELPTTSFTISNSEGYGRQLTNTFRKKTFLIHALSPLTFTLNSFDFPGWVASIKDIKSGVVKPLIITSTNDLRLITVAIPKGLYEVDFVFKNTVVRVIGEVLSIASLALFFYFFNRK